MFNGRRVAAFPRVIAFLGGRTHQMAAGLVARETVD